MTNLGRTCWTEPFPLQHCSDYLLKLIEDVYRWLPLGTLINNKVLVVHGGISDSTDLDWVRALDRHKVRQKHGAPPNLSVWGVGFFWPARFFFLFFFLAGIIFGWVFVFNRVRPPRSQIAVCACAVRLAVAAARHRECRARSRTHRQTRMETGKKTISLKIIIHDKYSWTREKNTDVYFVYLQNINKKTPLSSAIYFWLLRRLKFKKSQEVRILSKSSTGLISSVAISFAAK